MSASSLHGLEIPGIAGAGLEQDHVVVAPAAVPGGQAAAREDRGIEVQTVPYHTPEVW